MYLKSLTLKGFKSFAAPTTLRFEPGITCVVGPNGSGKSNVVDAIAWVLGEQGAKALRGGKMEDVVFAGSPGRPALGRAEVALTIDNADGRLPIAYSEVTIRRLMFRSGESEYSINGTRCRLLDVQELMSDSGIGRELHVVVGQGQLDAVLSARPEDRRGFVEEAAGVLKHRRRKEKALRKVEAMQANLTRLHDLTAELRRQLKPLGRQAEVARRAQQVQADLRDDRLRLLADDVTRLRADTASQRAEAAALAAERDEASRQLGRAQSEQAQLEQTAADQSPAVSQAQDTWFALCSLKQRLEAIAALATERHRHLLAPPTGSSRPHRDPDELDREAAAARAQEQALQDQLATDSGALELAVTRRTAAERLLAGEEQALMAQVRASSDRRESRARLTGQLGGLRSRVESAHEEAERLTQAEARAGSRQARAQEGLRRLHDEAGGLDDGEIDLDLTHERAELALASAAERLAALQLSDRAAERDCSTSAARRDALALALQRADGAGKLLDRADLGVLGAVAGLVSVESGYEAAIAAVLGDLADAVTVSSTGAAVRAICHLRADGLGRAGLLVAAELADEPPADDPPAEPADDTPADDPPAGGGPARPAPPESGRWAVDLVTAPPPLRAVLQPYLHGVVVVAGLAEAAEAVDRSPGLRAVTHEGDLLGATWSVGGAGGAPSLLETQAAYDDAQALYARAKHQQERLGLQLDGARADVESAGIEVAAALVALHDSDARMVGLAEQLALLTAELRTEEAEIARLQQARERAQQARADDLAVLTDVEHRLAAVEHSSADAVSTSTRDARAVDASTARAQEMEARLAVRTGEERAGGLRGRAASLEQAARSERQARDRQAVVLERRAKDAGTAAWVSGAAQDALRRIESSVLRAQGDRERAQTHRDAGEAELRAVRTRTRELTVDVDRLTAGAHAADVVTAERRLRLESLESRAEGDYGVPADSLVEDYGPHIALPPADDDGEPTPYVRLVQEKRAAGAERALATLGRINPLALEEYAALEERSAFLTTQLEDLKDTRRDLMTLIRDVDERIQEVFATAFQDTAREFVQVFGTLFPGGEGRLVLTHPDDLLVSGIEVLARPAGKKVSRLSLLSGGERSLTAIALLVAIFRARPSPFYVVDEIEAALDDRNLGRLLELLEGLRETSQLIVITHQKRTMEIADALYGVTMRGDGMSTVISQRLREREPA